MRGIKILIIEPGNKPYVSEISGDLISMQNIDGGYIETLSVSDTAVLVCNEEGKLNNLPPNCWFGNDIIVGTFFIVGDDNPEFCSISESDICKYTQMFSQRSF